MDCNWYFWGFSWIPERLPDGPLSSSNACDFNGHYLQYFFGRLSLGCWDHFDCICRQLEVPRSLPSLDAITAMSKSMKIHRLCLRSRQPLVVTYTSRSPGDQAGATCCKISPEITPLPLSLLYSVLFALLSFSGTTSLTSRSLLMHSYLEFCSDRPDLGQNVRSQVVERVSYNPCFSLCAVHA